MNTNTFLSWKKVALAFISPLPFTISRLSEGTGISTTPKRKFESSMDTAFSEMVQIFAENYVSFMLVVSIQIRT